MKKNLLNYLVCPITKEELLLTVFREEEEEVIEGLLSTSDGQYLYPIIGGVPRMLPPELKSRLKDDYPDFFIKYDSRLSLKNINESEVGSVQRHTQSAFGHEWTWASDYDADNFQDWLPSGYTAENLFTGKIGLEVGCGAGRHAERNSRLAKVHIAVDLSIAVDSAFSRNRNYSNCHVVQADAFNLPFRDETFDYVYCLGVIQHMHNPPEGFKHLARMPKRDGALLVNVYQAGRPLTVGVLEIFRKLTTKMDNNSLQFLSEVLGYIEYFIFIYPWKLIKSTSMGKLLRPLVPTRVDEYAKHNLRTAIVDWFDRLSCPVKIHYTDQQLRSWYENSSYKEILVTPYWKAFWNGYGRRI